MEDINVRELWDTVVLRDILGYTVPGAVTLFALAVLAGSYQWETPHDLLGRALDLGALWGGRWPDWHPWLAAAVVLPLSFAVGHLQVLIVEYLEQKLPAWHHERTALDCLEGDGGGTSQNEARGSTMGDEYREAALRFFASTRAYTFGERLQSAAPPRRRSATPEERGAWQLWKLCDYHVQQEAPGMHATYMGRYYVLALLFSNLGVSLGLLGVSLGILGLVPPLHSAGPAEGNGLVLVISSLAVCALLVAAFALRELLPGSRVVARAFTGVCVAASVALPLSLMRWPGWRFYTTQALLVFAGVLLMHRSGHCRDEFVRRAFPIFYVLTVQARTVLGGAQRHAMGGRDTLR